MAKARAQPGQFPLQIFLKIFLASALGIWIPGALAVLGILPLRLLAPSVAVLLLALGTMLVSHLLTAGTRAAMMASTLALLVSVANFRAPTAADTGPTSQQPWELLRHGTLCLNDAPIAREAPQAFWMLHTKSGCIASAYPPGMALLAAPFYLPTLLTNAPGTDLLSQFDKLAASLLSAAAVLLLGFALNKAGSTPRWIFFGAATYGVASSALSLLSQTLWQQTGVSLAIATLLYLAVNPNRNNRWFAFSACALVALIRAPDLILVVPLVLVSRSWRIYIYALFGVLGGAAAFFIYNKIIFGGFLITGYQLMQRSTGFTLHEFPESTVGLLLAPTHGLIWYAPWVFTAMLAFRLRERITSACLLSALALLAMMSFWWAWWGGGGYGPRMMSEAQLPLAFALGRVGPSLAAAERRLTYLFIGLAFLSQAAFPFWLAGDPAFSYSMPWSIAGNPWGYLFGLH